MDSCITECPEAGGCPGSRVTCAGCGEEDQLKEQELGLQQEIQVSEPQRTMDFVAVMWAYGGVEPGWAGRGGAGHVAIRGNYCCCGLRSIHLTNYHF